MGNSPCKRPLAWSTRVPVRDAVQKDRRDECYGNPLAVVKREQNRGGGRNTTKLVYSVYDNNNETITGGNEATIA